MRRTAASHGGGAGGPAGASSHYPSESLSVPQAFGGGYGVGTDGRQAAFAQELDAKETLLLHLNFVKRGLLEANNFEQILDALATSKTVQANVVKNSVLQSILLVSALLFEHVLYPSVGGSSTLRHLFQIAWLWPITIASFLVSGVGNLRVATSVQSVSYHARSLSTFINDQSSRSAATAAVDYRGLTARVLEESYRAFLLANYLIVVHLLPRLPVPWIGSWLAFAYAAMINSYYLWESRWTEQGLTLKDRVKSLEQRYTYHFGFGLVITLCCFWHPSFFVNLAIFSLLYPIIFINASSPSSRPVPLSSRYPLSQGPVGLSSDGPSLSSSSHAPGGVDDPRAVMRANPFFPTRIPLLSLAAALHSVLVRVFSPSSGAGRAAGRVRQSRRKDKEMEEMEGGGGPDDAWPAGNASASATSLGGGGGAFGAFGGQPSPPPQMGDYGTTYGNGAQTLFDAPPIDGVQPLPVSGGDFAPNGAAIAGVPPPPPTVRKRAKGD